MSGAGQSIEKYWKVAISIAIHGCGDTTQAMARSRPTPGRLDGPFANKTGWQLLIGSPVTYCERWPRSRNRIKAISRRLEIDIQRNLLVLGSRNCVDRVSEIQCDFMTVARCSERLVSEATWRHCRPAIASRLNWLRDRSVYLALSSLSGCLPTCFPKRTASAQGTSKCSRKSDSSDSRRRITPIARSAQAPKWK